MRSIVYTIIVALLALTALSTAVMAGPPVGFNELGRIDIPADKIFTQGELAYALDDGCRLVRETPPEYECVGRLNVLAIESRQTTPIVIGQYELPDTAFVDLTLNGNYANIIAQKDPQYGNAADYRLSVVNVANVDEMREVNAVQLPVPFVSAFSMEIFANTLYLASSRGGLFIYNVAEPAEPIEVAKTLEDTEIFDMALVRGRLFVAGPTGFRIMDVANGGRPQPISTTPGDFSAVEVFGSVAYATEVYTCFTPDSPAPVPCGEILVEFDVSDPTNPIRRRNVLGGEGANIRAVARTDNYLLVAENKSVNVFDLETPSLGPVASYQPRFDQDNFGSPMDIDLMGGFIYVTVHMGTEDTSVRLIELGRRWITYLPFTRRSGQ